VSWLLQASIQEINQIKKIKTKKKNDAACFPLFQSWTKSLELLTEGWGQDRQGEE